MTRPAFDEYVTARSGALLRFAYVLCGDRHLAEDLVQEVLVKAHRRWSAIEADNPDGYLMRALVRAHTSWRRRRASTEIASARFPETPDGSRFDDAQASRDEIWRMLASLPRAQRAVLVLRYFEDLDDRRIAELVGTSASTVRVHAHRGLQRLRETLAQRADEAPPSTGMLEGVRRGVKRSAARRRAVAAGGVAVAVAALMVLVPLMRRAPTGPPVEPTPSVTPPPSITPSPSVTPSPTTALPPLPGMAIYLSYEMVGSDAYQLHVHRLTGRDKRVDAVGSPVPGTNCAFNMPALSPDATMLAFAEGQGTPAGGLHSTGSLYVMDLGSGQSRLLAEAVGCFTATWTADSASLLVQPPDRPCQLIRVADGSLGTFGDEDCGYVAFAPGGAYRAQYPEIQTMDGDVVATLPSQLPAGAPGVSGPEVFGVSVDGRYVAMGEGNSDPGRNRTGRFVFDTETREFIDDATLLGPGHPDERISSVAFLADGGILVSTLSTAATPTYAWYLLSDVGTAVAAMQDAPGLIETGWFAYLP